jgi:hypothetical protein
MLEELCVEVTTEAEIEALHDLMDLVWGYCATSRALYPNILDDRSLRENH